MSIRKLLLGLLPLALVIVLLAVLSQLGAEGDDGTRSPLVYVGSDACQSCHPEFYAGWNGTHHPGAWNTLIANMSKVEACEKCHVTGWGDELHGGFNSTTDSPVYLRGIQCEACHGPGGDHVNDTAIDMNVNLSASVCGAVCHQEEHHPYYNEWTQSGHALSLISLRGASGAAEDSCLQCHSADYILEDNASNRPSVGTAQYAITCALCHDPHNATNPNQLRWPIDELCNRCHNPEGAIPGDPIYHPQSSMRDGRSGAPILGDPFMPNVECADCHIYVYKPNITGHSFTQKPEACVKCHSTTPPIYSVEQAQTQIAEWRSDTWDRVIEVQQDIVLAQSAIDDASDYGFPQSTIEIAVDLFNEAEYSLDFVVADGSAGAHNPTFTHMLLNFSEERSNQLIAMLTPGTIRGRVVDSIGSPVEGVTIEKDGKVWATSLSDGTFQFMFAPGSHSFELKLGGSHVGSTDSVNVQSGGVVQIGDVAITEEDFIVPIVIAIVALILLVVIILYLLFKTRETGTKKEEP